MKPGIRAFSSEVETGSRQENASNQESGAPFRFHRNGKGSSVWPSIVIAVAFVAGIVSARAQDYPSRSITVIVPFPPGGASDVVARIVTNQMSRISRAILHYRKCQRRRRHGRRRARGGRRTRRLHAACSGHGLACGGTGAHAKRQVRSANGLRADRHHRSFTGSRYRAKGFPGT